MNILTSHRDHTRLRRQLRAYYTEDNIQKYMDHAHQYAQLRVTLYTISAHALGLIALGLIALTTAAYNGLRFINGDGDGNLSIIELAFPLLALAYSWTVHRTNKGLYAKYTSEAIEHVNNAKHINELMNRNGH